MTALKMQGNERLKRPARGTMRRNMKPSTPPSDLSGKISLAQKISADARLSALTRHKGSVAEDLFQKIKDSSR
jgi:hypothetical protein